MSIKDVHKNLKKLAGMSLFVGWNEGNKYKNGVPVASVAVTHEYGAPGANIPPRPFIRPATDAHWDDWNSSLEKGVRRVMNGKIKPKDMLIAVGHVIRADIQQAISEVRDPPLAESTKRARDRKGRSYQPLNDTGLMIASVHPVVLEGEE